MDGLDGLVNYEVHYNTLIERAKNRLLECYTERHHIIPKCLSGTNDTDNLVDLTAEEHFLAHQLLVKMHPGNRKLIFAARMMTGSPHGHRSNNKLYGWLRKQANEIGFSDETKAKMSVSAKIRYASNPYTKEQREAISERLTGIVFTEERRQNISNAKKGIKFSEEHKRNLSEAAKTRKRHPMSEETKRKIGEKALALGRGHTAETRKKISEIQTGRKWSAKRRATYEASKSAK